MYTYNIYLNSPLLACNLNRKKYYINIINKNNYSENLLKNFYNIIYLILE